MNNKTMWRYTDYTQAFIDKVTKEIVSAEEDLTSGSLLMQKDSEVIAREYAYNIGYVEGLRFLESYFDSEEETNDENASLSGENESKNYY